MSKHFEKYKALYNAEDYSHLSGYTMPDGTVIATEATGVKIPDYVTVEGYPKWMERTHPQIIEAFARDVAKAFLIDIGSFVNDVYNFYIVALEDGNDEEVRLLSLYIYSRIYNYETAAQESMWEACQTIIKLKGSLVYIECHLPRVILYKMPEYFKKVFGFDKVRFVPIVPDDVDIEDFDGIYGLDFIGSEDDEGNVLNY